MCSRGSAAFGTYSSHLHSGTGDWAGLFTHRAAVEYGDYIYFYSPCGLSDCGTSAGVVST